MRAHSIKLLPIFLVILFIFLQYRLWISEGGLIDMFRFKKQYAMAQQENEKLKQRNQVLLERVQNFKKNPSLAESRARHELGMIRKDEKFYQVVK